MPGPFVAGTFSTGSAASSGGTPSDVCVINAGRTQLKLTLTGLDASNSVKTQKRTAPGSPFVDQTTYTSNQNATPVSVTTGEEWRLITVAMQPIRDIRYALDAQ